MEILHQKEIGKESFDIIIKKIWIDKKASPDILQIIINLHKCTSECGVSLGSL